MEVIKLEPSREAESAYSTAASLLLLRPGRESIVLMACALYIHLGLHDS